MIEEEYIKTGKVRYIYRPFGDFANDRSSRLAAESIYCAGEQGKFWELEHWMYVNQDTWYGTDVIATLVDTAAPALGLDGAALRECLQQERYASHVIGFYKDAVARGVTGTPFFLVGDQTIAGAYPIDTFRQAIEEELQP